MVETTIFRVLVRVRMRNTDISCGLRRGCAAVEPLYNALITFFNFTQKYGLGHTHTHWPEISRITEHNLFQIIDATEFYCAHGTVKKIKSYNGFVGLNDFCVKLTSMSNIRSNKNILEKIYLLK